MNGVPYIQSNFAADSPVENPFIGISREMRLVILLYFLIWRIYPAIVTLQIPRVHDSDLPIVLTIVVLAREALTQRRGGPDADEAPEPPQA